MSQTGWAGNSLTEHTWRQVLRERLCTLDWGQVAADVRPFLAPGADPDLLTVENVLRVIGQEVVHRIEQDVQKPS